MVDTFRIFCTAIILISCNASSHAQPPAIAPADKKATKETIALYKNLMTLKEKGFMFGHQDDLAYGVTWRYQKDRSDVKDVTGDYPAVYGYDLCGLEQKKDSNIDGVPFKNMQQYIKDGYKRGGVITLSWHFNSPLGAAKGAWDTTHGTVASILPGGKNNLLFNSWLDEGAKFISALKGDKGEAIPVLFRPLHELSGNWFWWGRNACTPDEFKALYKYIVQYLQQQKGLHNLLIIYNTSDNIETEEALLERYPGDDVVDVLSFDTYQNGDSSSNKPFVQKVNTMVTMFTKVAKEKNKIAAIAEMGYEAIPYKNWWTEVLMNAVGNNKVSYVLMWRNHGLATWANPPKMHYYVPYKGQVSENDFIKFYNLEKTLFEKDVAKEKLYK